MQRHRFKQMTLGTHNLIQSKSLHINSKNQTDTEEVLFVDN